MRAVCNGNSYRRLIRPIRRSGRILRARCRARRYSPIDSGGTRRSRRRGGAGSGSRPAVPRDLGGARRPDGPEQLEAGRLDACDEIAGARICSPASSRTIAGRRLVSRASTIHSQPTPIASLSRPPLIPSAFRQIVLVGAGIEERLPGDLGGRRRRASSRTAVRTRPTPRADRPPTRSAPVDLRLRPRVGGDAFETAVHDVFGNADEMREHVVGAPLRRRGRDLIERRRDRRCRTADEFARALRPAASQLVSAPRPESRHAGDPQLSGPIGGTRRVR